MSVVDSVRGRWRDAKSTQYAQRFLDKPYASVQLVLLASVGLLGFGIMMAVSTTIAAAHDVDGTGSTWGQVVKEAFFIAVGLVVFAIAARTSPRVFRMVAYPVLALAVLALLVVLAPGLGDTINGSTRWINVGPMQVQPSELAKLAMLLWGADLLARKQQLGTLKRARHLFVPLLPGFAFVVALVMLEPDLGTTCCFMLILLGLLWMIGMPLRYFAAVLLAVAGAVTLLAIAEPYRLQRLTSFTQPFQHKETSGYHTVESLYALGSGGLWGVGLGNGTSKYWVPNANSDYVFAIIGEELGLLGCAAVLLLFGVFAYAGIRIVRRSADPFVRLTAGAATIWLCGQAVINIGYVTALLPVTGIPLPLISAGGTSLVVTFFVIGMLVSFGRHEPAAVAAARKAHRLGRRSRIERWARVPVPQGYAPPKRRSRPAGPARTAPRSQPARPAAPRRSAAPQEPARVAAVAQQARPRTAPRRTGRAS